MNTLWHLTLSRIFLLIGLVAIVGGAGIYYFESRSGTQQFSSLGEALWWSVVTMTTVGYGDYTPQGGPGRVFAVIIMFSGIALVSFLTATIASVSVARRLRANQGLMPIKVKNHIIICGWHHKIERLVDAFMQIDSGNKEWLIVLVNEETEDRMQSLKSQHGYSRIKYIRGEFTRETILKKANIETARAVVIFPKEELGGGVSDEKSILATLTVKNLNPKIQVVVYVHNQTSIAHMRRANADNVVLADNFGSFIIASHILNPGIPQIADELLSASSDNHLRRVAIPKEFVGKSFSELSKHHRVTEGWITVGLYMEEQQVGIGSFLSADGSQLDAFIEKMLRKAGHPLGEGSHTTVSINPGDTQIIHEGEGALVIQ